MTMEDFLAQLDAQLYVLTPEERESAVSYYREYLEEAGADVRAAINALGSPQSVAQRILREIDENRVVYDGGGTRQFAFEDPLAEAKPQPQPQKGGRLGLTILVIVLSFPVWITVFALWFSIVACLAALVGGFAFAAVGATLQGINEYLAGRIGQGLWDIGSGVTCLGLLLLTWKPCWIAGKFLTLGLGKLCKSCISGLMGKEA